MPDPVENFYAEWRVRGGIVPALQEELHTPPERLLQAVWNHQRLLRDQLTTLDGRRVQVLHPGFLNRESGPDFRGAVLQFDQGAPQTGDVEIDLHSSGWRAHHHQENPAFREVTLHVVWESGGKTELPTLELRQCLDAPLGELHYWFGSEAAQTFSEAQTGRCREPLQALKEAQILEILTQAARVRLQSKAAWFQARARHAGWEQGLWEGLFRALGYKHNVWPMQRLAEMRLQLLPIGSRLTSLVLQARLLGAAGLLPDELTRKETDTDAYLRRLWDCWWRERDLFRECILPRSLWRFHGLRPANHPQRRLALAAHWLLAGNFTTLLENWCRSRASIPKLAEELETRLRTPEDEYWSWHWTLKSKRLQRAVPLMGSTRLTDLAVNVLLPWLWARAREGKNDSLLRELERRYLEWPAAEDNAVLRLARLRLLGSAAKKCFRTAGLQQGLIQITRDFCDHSNATCADCRFPELVRERAPCE